MPNLDLNTIALVSTLNPAALNGAPSSTDYNDFQNQTLLDLTSIAGFVNNILIPMLQVLPSTALSGLEGSTIYGDTTDQTALFYDSGSGTPLVIADSLRQLNALLSSNSITLSNLAITVGQLQQSLSSINQNSIANTLQSLTASINTLNTQQTSIYSSIAQLQTEITNLEFGQQSAIVLTDTSTGTEYLLAISNGQIQAIPQ